jgi:hypothetical protein
MEERESKTSELLVQLRSLNTSFKVEPRELEVYKRVVESVTAWDQTFWDEDLWDFNNTDSVSVWNEFRWNRDNWNGGAEGDLELINLIPGNNVYEELLYDDKYFDDDLSDDNVVWDYTSNEITIPDTEVMYTKLISLNASYNNARVRLTADLDDYTVEITYNNGADWIEVENYDNVILFPTPSTGVRLRVTSTVNTPFGLIKDSAGRITQPAMRVRFNV